MGEVQIRVDNVFDDLPAENHAVYRLLNRLHRKTRPSVIRRQLLFREGDPYSERITEETERLLRSNEYLYDAEIRSVPAEDGSMDVEVVTQDVWSLTAGLSFGRGGGSNSTGFKLEDTNLLGTGRSLTLERLSSVDRERLLVRFSDDNLAAHRLRLTTLHSDNDDGSRQELLLERPFYSLDSRWAGGLRLIADDRVDSLWNRGVVIDRFRHELTYLELSGGLSEGLRNGWVTRWSAGLTYQRDHFDGAPDVPPTGFLPEDRILAYPWLGWERVEDAFVETRNRDHISRTEDLDLGRRYRLRLGLSTTALGATLDGAIIDGAAAGGFRPTPRQTWLWSADSNFRWQSSGVENLLAGGELRYTLRDLGDHLLLARIDGRVAHDLDPEKQLLLGGDNGLRGYPLRYLAGDRHLLFSLEQRVFTPWHPFGLFYVGAAAFFDAGRSWGDTTADTPDLGLLKDVGVGLRLSSRRTGGGSVLHFDLAFPLDGDRSIQSVQWLVESKASF